MCSYYAWCTLLFPNLFCFLCCSFCWMPSDCWLRPRWRYHIPSLWAWAPSFSQNPQVQTDLYLLIGWGWREYKSLQKGLARYLTWRIFLSISAKCKMHLYGSEESPQSWWYPCWPGLPLPNSLPLVAHAWIGRKKEIFLTVCVCCSGMCISFPTLSVYINMHIHHLLSAQWPPSPPHSPRRRRSILQGNSVDDHAA